ncbi:MAG: biotin--[acetyl-CoA-carboxylase] ligase [Chloroflexi bacterium]|nr:biotin--[acetyl-CoA-carboxylase] ligase [Chloroflexota bacterium]
MNEDILSAEVIAEGLETRFVEWRVLYYPRVGSTMDIAREEAQRGAPEGTLIIAGEQTAGRGRLRRTWLTPTGNIALSMILYPGPIYMPYLTMLASLAVIRCVRQVTNLSPCIKWPNDVLINGRKMCGILVESGVQGNAVGYSIVGIGLNVNFRLEDFPEVQTTATALSQEMGKEVSRLAVLRSLLAEIERLYLALTGGESVYEEWREALVTLGQRVRVIAGRTVYEGIAESVTRDGSLILRQADGNRITVVAGDVTLKSEEQ